MRQALADPPTAGPVVGRRYVMGVDFGRYHDFTAVVVIDASAAPVPAVVALHRYNEVKGGVRGARFGPFARRWRVGGILAEANAMGEPNIDALRAEGLPIQPFVTTARSKQTLIESLASAIESADVRLLADDTLLGELEAYTYEMDRSGGHTRYTAPPGLHDDTVIALALAWQLVTTPRLVLAIAEV